MEELWRVNDNSFKRSRNNAPSLTSAENSRFNKIGIVKRRRNAEENVQGEG